MSILQMLTLIYSNLGHVIVPHGPDDGPPPSISQLLHGFGGELIPDPYVLLVVAEATAHDWAEQVHAVLGDSDGRYDPGAGFLFFKCKPVVSSTEAA